MSVHLTPEGQLGFHRPYSQLVKRTLTVANPNDRPIMFKVKTTAPKQYCVRPNSGRIEPNERLEVQVLLQPMKEDPPLSAKCRDKFLVQSAIIPKERDTLLMSELWQIVEKEEKDSVHEQKIRCVYLPPNEDDGGYPVTGPSNGSHLTPSRIDNRPASGDESAYSTVRSLNASSLTNGDNSFEVASSSLSRDPAPILDRLSDAAPAAPLAGAAGLAGAAAVSLGLNSDVSTETAAPAAKSDPSFGGARGVSNDQSLRQQLLEAKTEVERLKAQLKEVQSAPQLRQRTTGAASSSAVGTTPVVGHDTQLQTTEGVPVHVVVGIAFGVFFVTWLFF